MATIFFSKEEKQLIKDTAEIALANAAKSFGKMLKDKVLLQNLTLNLSLNDSLQSANLGEKVYHVLKTDILGQMKAVSFLIFSDTNAIKTYRELLPKSLVGNPEMRQAMLLEIDNILAASVVTKYADILNRKINGHVPEIELYSLTQLQQIIPTNTHDSMDFSFKVTFKAQNKSIEAEFVCFFAEMFALTISERSPLTETSEIVEANKSDSEISFILGRIRDVINQVLGG